MSKRNSNNKRKIIGILLIITIVISGGIGLTAYSMYKSQIQQAVEAQIAKWSFKVYSGTGENRKEITQEISLADSRTDGKEEQVAKGKIAPGTNGEFILEIDGSGSEIAIDYEVSIDTLNKPTNLKFYTDNTYTTQMELLDGKITAFGGIELDEVNIPKQITIYWKWDFETKTKVEKIQNSTEKMLNALQNLAQKKQIEPETVYESYKTENGITDELTIEQKIEAILNNLNNQADTETKIIEINDVIDTAESGTTTSMKITVIGEQRDPNEQSLSQGNIEIVTPTSGTYSAGEVITIRANYTDKIYGAPNRVAVTQQTAPVLKIKFGTGDAQETTFSGVGTDGKSLLYTYTVKEDDEGSLEVDSYTGNVYSKRGVVLAVETKALSQGDITVKNAKKLADVVQVGDIVNYNANVKDESGNSYTITPSSSETGYSTTTTFSSTDSMTWKVLSVDKQAGKVELMAITPNKIFFSNVAGYKNAPSILNNIAQIYGHGYGAESARSITVEDVDQYTSYDKTTYSNSDSSTGKYGGTKSYSFASKLTYPFTVEGAKSGETSDVTINSSGTYTVPQTYYCYKISNYKKSGISDNVYSMLTENSYWLASRYCNLNSSRCYLGVRIVNSGGVYGSDMFNSGSNTYSGSWSACSVVSLKSNIRTSGQDSSGVWQLK